MSGAIVPGALLALLASLALNAGYLIQHRGGRDAPPVDVRRPLRTLAGLLRSRVWLLGTATGTLGWALFVAALALAPLSVAQAFAGGGLALVVPLAARVTGRPLAARERAAVPAIAVGLALLAVGTRDPGARTADHEQLLPLLVGASLAAGALLALPAGGRRPQLLGVAAGVFYGAADAATKAVCGAAAHDGLLPALVSPWAAALVALTAAAFFCFQRGLQSGRPLPVIALMATATSLVAVVGGLAAFAEPLGQTPLLAALRIVGLVTVAVAGWVLAPAPSRLLPAARELAGQGPALP
ncbi:hypothetical protein [Patulibacter defluvii]|uniref:hypothetical protein n=1 Tax=Patulibacter defluvii TaxID=3095358 RepID=UPI002A750659|nr:hypothetical protein [Patulibacter sp. DM4]